MKIFGERIVLSVRDRAGYRCKHAVCDICGTRNTLGEPDFLDGNCKWTGEPYQSLKTTVSLTREGVRPRGEFKTILSMHICPGCFMSQLVEFVAKFKNDQDKLMFPTVDEIDR